MDYEIPDGPFFQKEFSKLNGIKHSKCAWRVLNRYTKSGKLRLVRVDKRKKIYMMDTQPYARRYVSRRTPVCPPNQRDYIYRLMGVQSDGGGGGNPS